MMLRIGVWITIIDTVGVASAVVAAEGSLLLFFAQELTMKSDPQHPTLSLTLANTFLPHSL